MNDEARAKPTRQDDDGPEPQHDGNGSSFGKNHGDSAPVPFSPHKDDDSPLGDTDQHSDA
jgi:hypothetical protein